MAANGEDPDPPPNVIAQYTERVENIAQVNVGELVLVRALPPAGMQLPPGIVLGNDRIERVRAKEQNHAGRGPAIQTSIFWVQLQPPRREIMRFAVFRRPAGPAAAGAAGGKRRRRGTRRQKKRRSTRR
jgi:hypothetical protein